MRVIRFWSVPPISLNPSICHARSVSKAAICPSNELLPAANTLPDFIWMTWSAISFSALWSLAMRLSYHARNKGVENFFVFKSYVLRRLIVTDGVARHFLYPTGLCQVRAWSPDSVCNWIKYHRHCTLSHSRFCATHHSIPLDSRQYTRSTSRSCSRSYHLSSDCRLTVIVIECWRLSL